jgi:hypothetical protein
MSGRNWFASILMSCLLAAGCAGLAPDANAASAGQFLSKPGAGMESNATEITYRRHGPRLRLRIGPSYRGYEYPYYHSRGYYPRYIGPGYIYHYPIYDYSPAYRRPAYGGGGRCAHWRRQCIANWGYGGPDYHGCMDFHHCP